jgi:uncharacterized membrane protein YphA (DoxX/SURF4 family)
MMHSAPFNLRRLIMWVGRILLGCIFIYAAYSKIFLPNKFYWPWPMLRFSISANLSNFAFQVESYKILPPAAVTFVSNALPFAELALGLLLLIGWRLRIWGTLASLLLVTFLAAVTRAYIFHMDINCGCFATPEPVSLKKILEDSSMVLLAVLMTVFAFQEARKPHPWSATTEAPVRT